MLHKLVVPLGFIGFTKAYGENSCFQNYIEFLRYQQHIRASIRLHNAFCLFFQSEEKQYKDLYNKVQETSNFVNFIYCQISDQMNLVQNEQKQI